jgi:predicted membrane protein
MDSRLFWGVIIVILGVSLILNHLFKINLPIFKILLGLGIIYIGVTVLMSGFNVSIGNSDGQHAIFSTEQTKPEVLNDREEFNSIFGKMTVDLRQSEIPDRGNLEVNAVFGSATVYLPPNVRVHLKSGSVFGSVKNQERSLDGIGESSTDSGPADAVKQLDIEANAIFGEVRIKQ